MLDCTVAKGTGMEISFQSFCSMMILFTCQAQNEQAAAQSSSFSVQHSLQSFAWRRLDRLINEMVVNIAMSDDVASIASGRHMLKGPKQGESMLAK